MECYGENTECNMDNMCRCIVGHSTDECGSCTAGIYQSRHAKTNLWDLQLMKIQTMATEISFEKIWKQNTQYLVTTLKIGFLYGQYVKIIIRNSTQDRVSINSLSIWFTYNNDTILWFIPNVLKWKLWRCDSEQSASSCTLNMICYSVHRVLRASLESLETVSTKPSIT